MKGGGKEPKKFTMNRWAKEATTPAQKQAAAVRDHEEHAASLLEVRGAARRRPGSGAHPLGKGDAVSMKDLGECKMTGRKSIRIKRDWLQKIQNEAAGEGKMPFLHLRFQDCDENMHPDWVMIPDWWFQELIEAHEEVHGDA